MSVVRTLTVARELGKINDQQFLAIDPYVQAGATALREWRKALAENRTTDAYAVAANSAIDALIAWRVTVERN